MAVRGVAAREHDPLDPFRGMYVDDAQAVTLGAGRGEPGLDERLTAVADRLGLDDLERAVLALCVAPEVHPDFGRIFGYLHDDLTRRAASPRLVAALLAGQEVATDDVLRCCSARARLLTSGALRLAPDPTGGPLADRAILVAPQLAAHVLGWDLADLSRGGALRRVEPTRLPLGRPDVVQRLRRLLTARHTDPNPLPLVVTGADASALLVRAAQAGLVVTSLAALDDDTLAADLALATALDRRVPVVDGLTEVPGEARARALARALALPCRPVLHAEDTEALLALADRSTHVVRCPPPDHHERAAAWRAAAPEVDEHQGLAGRFRLDVTRIDQAVRAARAAAGENTLGPADLAVGARVASSQRIGELAQRLEPGPGWDDLVLPVRSLSPLRTLSSFLVHRDRVLDDWGLRRVVSRTGLTALFVGESGTGKTMAARVLAREAGLDVYRVDLSALFSKWVGETEKNLDRIFTVADSSNAVLFFDEADVVFGKRTDTQSGSDRYGNLQTAFLLQRVEDYSGVVVLATNLRANIDAAFLRRIDLLVDFPPPPVATRRLLWDALLPAELPREEGLDLDFLAERFELTGGGIRNCSVFATLLAAQDEAALSMGHLIRAVGAEYAKLGRLTLEADFEPFWALLKRSGL